MRIAHLSDLHIDSPDFLRISELFWGILPNRRILGAANFVFGRSSVHSLEVLRAAVNAVDDARADHCVVTGDLSNLAIDAEFRFVRSVLDGIGGPERLSLVPGNHDCYTPESVRSRRFERHFGDLIDPLAGADVTFPAHKDIQGCRLILARTPTRTPPGFSYGRLGTQQMERILTLATEAAGQGMFVILAQHHHLNPRKGLNELTGPFKDRDTELAMIAESPISVVIHGHDHRHHDWEVCSKAPCGKTRIICCGSSTYMDSRRDRFGRMTVLEITNGEIQVEKWMYQPNRGRFAPLREN